MKREFPLLTRAWAFQERLLARRIIYLGQNELFWECTEGYGCECGRYKPTFDGILAGQIRSLLPCGVEQDIIQENETRQLVRRDNLPRNRKQRKQLKHR